MATLDTSEADDGRSVVGMVSGVTRMIDEDGPTESYGQGGGPVQRTSRRDSAPKHRCHAAVVASVAA